MKQAGTNAEDELRAGYKRSDFGKLVRGKYVERLLAEVAKRSVRSRPRSRVRRPDQAAG